MKKTIIKGFTIVLAAALVLCVFITAYLMEVRFTSQMEVEMCNLVTAFSNGYDSDRNASDIVTDFAQESQNLRITIIAKDGTVLGDSQADYNMMENHAGRTEIVQAQNGVVGLSKRNSRTIGKQLMYAALQMPDGNYLRIATEYGGFLGNVLQLWPALLLAGIIAFALGMGMATSVADSIAKPIAHLSSALKTVQNERVPLVASAYPYAELRAMASDINSMAKQIHQNIARVEQEKNKIDYILDNMAEGFILLDEKQNVLLINHTACTVLGCSSTLVHGRNIVHATRSVSVLEAVEHVLLYGEYQRVDWQSTHGKTYEVLVSSVVAQEHAGVERGVVLLFSDVTALRNVVKTRQRFFESASHELKTPITSIKGFAELLCSGMAIEKTQQDEISQRILKETTRMNSLIADIIMISRLESGDILFDREPIDIAQVVQEVCQDFMATAQHEGVTLTCETQPLVRSASHREITELVGNLVSNAIRYNVPNGRVEVALQSGITPCITVFNTGEPIPRQYQERVFERFFRLDKGRSKANGGTGLGLAIVKHIASGYNAIVMLTPKEDGNLFTIQFAQ